MSCANSVKYYPIYDNMGFQDPLWPRSSVGTNVNCWSKNIDSTGMIKLNGFGKRKSKRKSVRKGRKSKRKSVRKIIKRRKNKRKSRK